MTKEASFIPPNSEVGKIGNNTTLKKNDQTAESSLLSFLQDQEDDFRAAKAAAGSGGGGSSKPSYSNNNSWTDNMIHTPLSLPPPPESQRKLLYAGLAAGTTVLGTLGLMAPFVWSRSPLPYMATPGHKVRRALEFAVTQIIEKQGLCHHKAVASIANSSVHPTNNQLSPIPSFSSPNQHTARTLPKTFLDLGSGDGEAVYQALQAGYDRAIGIELNYTLYLIAQLRRWLFWSRDERQRSDFVCGDFFAYPRLDQADTIMIFGIQQASFLKRVSQTLQQEVTSRSDNGDDQRLPLFVLAYRFPLPVQPTNSSDQDKKNETRKKDGSAFRALAGLDTRGRDGASGLFSGELIYEEEEMRIYQSK